MRFAGENRCAGYFLDARRCLASGRRYDSIFVISGHHDRSTDLELTAQFNALVAAATGGRNKLASVPIGRDDDAPAYRGATRTEYFEARLLPVSQGVPEGQMISERISRSAPCAPLRSRSRHAA
jgi:hypothetical protein